MTSVLRSATIVVVGCLFLAACGGSNGGKVASTPGTTPTSAVQASSTAIEPTSTTKQGGTATTARPASSTTASTSGATTTTGATPPGVSGVRGVVKAGPQCPVQRQGDTSCDDKPVPAHLTLQRGDGTTAASADAAGDGQFFIAAGAGSYTLTATTPNAMRCASQPVTVTAGHVTDVQVSCDTGIR